MVFSSSFHCRAPRLVRALRGLPIRQLCLLCLLPLLLSACFMPQSWVDSSPAADKALHDLANDPGTFLKESFALMFSSPSRDKDGLFGLFPENYEDPKNDFSLWMPANMNTRFGGNHDFMQGQIDACVNGWFRGVRYAKPDKDVYKQLDENTRLYAYYISYSDVVYDGTRATFDDKIEPLVIEGERVTVFNMTVNREGFITSCKYWRFWN